MAAGLTLVPGRFRRRSRCLTIFVPGYSDHGPAKSRLMVVPWTALEALNSRALAFLYVCGWVRQLNSFPLLLLSLAHPWGFHTHIPTNHRLFLLL